MLGLSGFAGSAEHRTLQTGNPVEQMMDTAEAQCILTALEEFTGISGVPRRR